MNQNEFRIAHEIVEDIARKGNARNKLLLAMKYVSPENHREFYRHASSLFLNVMLNRQNELGEKSHEFAQEARMVIVSLIEQPPL